MKIRKWTYSEIKFLKENYHNMTNQNIADKLQRSLSSIHQKGHLLRLKKDKDFLKELNKQNLGFQRHQFKKGNRPHNTKDVGYERITKDGYVEVKVAGPNVFELKHRWIWKQANGEIPKGYNIQFKDGNRQNCRIDNLYMISRSQQLSKENSMFARYPKELQKLIKVKGALTRQINKRKENE